MVVPFILKRNKKFIQQTVSNNFCECIYLKEEKNLFNLLLSVNR